ncbi:MAG: DUF21 domain-containing protein [Deltaproteobacteria bacterium]|nr:MAG: DUF21 domain-containing protein [Deltaproteobacteria bacterium]
MTEGWTWLLIGLCVTQSASLSGLNIALFSISRLRLEAAAHEGDARARRVLELRKDANRTLATILWGNVAVNVLLTLLADSVLVGVGAFLFSTVVITFGGEIIPQAFFTRHALRVASLLAPLLRLWMVLLWPVAAPVGWVLDRVVGPETIPWYREKELRQVLRHHAREDGSEVGSLEAIGAINFLKLDDLPVSREGEVLSPGSVIEVAFEGNRPVLPDIGGDSSHPFVRGVASSGRKWVVLVDEGGAPRAVLNAHLYLREVFVGHAPASEPVWHHPLIVRDPERPLGEVLGRLTVHPEHADDDVIDRDLILVWGNERRIITGSDLLGRLLRGISRNPHRPQGQVAAGGPVQGQA